MDSVIHQKCGMWYISTLWVLSIVELVTSKNE